MKYILLELFLCACGTRFPEDPLVKMSEDVEKRDRGIDIQIKPMDKEK